MVACCSVYRIILDVLLSADEGGQTYKLYIYQIKTYD